MAQVHLFNARPAGGPSIVLPIPGRNEVVIPAEGTPDSTGNDLIDGAEGVKVEVEDTARLRAQAVQIRGLVVK